MLLTQPQQAQRAKAGFDTVIFSSQLSCEDGQTNFDTEKSNEII